MLMELITNNISGNILPLTDETLYLSELKSS